MQSKHPITDRIMTSILGEPKPDPLSKSPCGFCGAKVMEKDMEDHLKTFHDDRTSLEPMFPETNDDE